LPSSAPAAPVWQHKLVPSTGPRDTIQSPKPCGQSLQLYLLLHATSWLYSSTNPCLVSATSIYMQYMKKVARNINCDYSNTVQHLFSYTSQILPNSHLYLKNSLLHMPTYTHTFWRKRRIIFKSKHVLLCPSLCWLRPLACPQLSSVSQYCVYYWGIPSFC
jgi:hypothetical protein